MVRCDEDLLHGDAARLAAFLGVSVHSVRRWKKRPGSMPEPVRKLLRLRFDGDASALLGDAWQGFYFQGGELYIPGWKYGFNPHQIRGMFFQVQEVRALRRELSSLKFRWGHVSRYIQAQPARNGVRFDVRHQRQSADRAD